MTRLLVKGNLAAIGVGDDVPEYAKMLSVHAEDYESEAEMLWEIVRLKSPRLALELGTRHGVSTRVMLSAMNEGAKLITVDPEDCRPWIQPLLDARNGPKLEFVQMTGEDYYRATPLWPDLIHIDTDPHSRDQTEWWIKFWVEERLKPGGIAVFHDMILPVGMAVRHWVARHPEWPYLELLSAQGLGVLRKPQGRDGESATDGGREP